MWTWSLSLNIQYQDSDPLHVTFVINVINILRQQFLTVVNLAHQITIKQILRWHLNRHLNVHNPRRSERIGGWGERIGGCLRSLHKAGESGSTEHSAGIVSYGRLRKEWRFFWVPQVIFQKISHIYWGESRLGSLRVSVLMETLTWEVLSGNTYQELYENGLVINLSIRQVTLRKMILFVIKTSEMSECPLRAWRRTAHVGPEEPPM